MIRKLARPMLASVYVADGVHTITHTDDHIEATKSVVSTARQVLPAEAAARIPDDPALVARTVGMTKVGAGALLALGKAPRLAAGMLALTAIPTIAGRYAFWSAESAEEKTQLRQGFLTNVALLGGLGITSMDTAGKPGVRWRAAKATQDAQQAVRAALPTQSERQSAVDQATSWLSDTTSQAQEVVSHAAATVGDYVADNKDDWLDTAGAAVSAAQGTALDLIEQGKSLTKDMADKAPDWTEQAQKSGIQLLDQAKEEGVALRKRLATAARKAQKKADKAAAQAQKKSGRTGKKAQKKAAKLQQRAEKAIDSALKHAK